MREVEKQCTMGAVFWGPKTAIKILSLFYSIQLQPDKTNL